MLYIPTNTVIKLFELNKIPLNPTREKNKNSIYFTPSVIPDEVKIGVFESITKNFKLNYMKKYCMDLITMIPDYIFYIPSSSTLKYHNKTQCGKYGNLYHILMVGNIMIEMLGLEQYSYISKKYDCMLMATIFHDSFKKGIFENQYVIHEHPILAQEFIMNVKSEHDIGTIDNQMKVFLSKLCASHSGQWTTNKYSMYTLPRPQTEYEKLLHLADYLGSRQQFDMIYSDEIENAICRLEEFYDDYLEVKFELEKLVFIQA